MFRELCLLLAACPVEADPDVLAEAILHENVLAKSRGTPTYPTCCPPPHLD